MSYVQGEDRGQAALLPAAIEDYVAADAPLYLVLITARASQPLSLRYVYRKLCSARRRYSTDTGKE